MSNTFNISVKPEIAALVVKVDSIKNDTGPIRNDVTSIHDILLPSIKADTGPIRNDVTAIHDTMLPSIKVDTAAIRNDVTDIHDTNLPAVKTDTGAIRNDVDDIKASIPQSFRGNFNIGYLNTTENTLQIVCSVTGQGKLYLVAFKPGNAADTAEIRITIDGVAKTISHTGDDLDQTVIPIIHDVATGGALLELLKIARPTTITQLFSIEFDTSLLVELRRSAGTLSWTRCKVYYSVD